MPIAVDGTSRHEAPRVHCTLGGTSSPHQLSRWWLLGGDEGWATLYAATQELDFKKTIMGCSWRHLQVYLVCCPGNTFFPVYRWQGTFLCAHGKAQDPMANCKNLKALGSQALVCWVYGCNRADCLANVGLESTIDGWSIIVPPIGAI